MSALLLFCFDTLDTFGKEPEQLENVDKLFQFTLQEFTIKEVKEAFQEYVKNNSVMPKPSDIVDIITGAKEKVWCSATFIDLRRRGREGQYLTPEERQYCDDFVAAKVEGNSKAIKQEKIESKQYWLEN